MEFFQLPPEIRLLIFEILAVDSSAPLQIAGNDVEPESTSFLPVDFRPAAASKQVSSELSAAFYGLNKFELIV